MATFHKHAAFSENVKQTVTADIVALRLKNDLKLPHAKPGHILADKTHLVDDSRVVYFFGIGGPALFPVTLAGKAEQPTKSI